MKIGFSGASKVQLGDYIKTEGLSEENKETMLKYLLTLHGLSEGTKEQYMLRLRKYGLWLTKNNIQSFQEAESEDVIAFFNCLYNKNTVNSYLTLLKPFYRFLSKTNVTKGIKFYIEDLQPVTPSEVLTPDEIMMIAEEAAKRKDIYKVIILTLFESCARIKEAASLLVPTLIIFPEAKIETLPCIVSVLK